MRMLLLKQPSAFLPVIMSAAALLLIAGYIVLFGTDPQPDEGTAAHLWQLLMGGQLPIVAWFALRWVPEQPGPGLVVLTAQVLAAFAAAFPVFCFHW